MKKWFGLVFLCLTLHSQAQLKPVIYKQLWQLAKNFPNHTELAVGIIDHGKKTYIGFRKERDTLLPVENKKNMFGIASLTKLFTAALIASEVHDKKLGLQDEIGKFYPFKIRYSGDAQKISIQDLCTHTSGLPADMSTGLESYLSHTVNLGYEGGRFRYSNLGYIILEDILERTSGKNYRDLLEQKLLLPMQLQNTSIDLENTGQEKLVEGRDAAGKKLPVKTSFAYEGVGGIKSSAMDLVTFMEYQFFKRSRLAHVFKLMQKVYFKKDENESMGLGWHILQQAGDHVFYHNGYLSGYTSCIRYSQKKKRGVVLLSNVSAQHVAKDNIELLTDIFMANGK